MSIRKLVNDRKIVSEHASAMSRKCHRCFTFKAVEDYRLPESKACIICSKAHNLRMRIRRQTNWWIDGVAHCKYSDKKKNRYDEKNIVDKEFLKKLYTDQKECCFYCKVKMITNQNLIRPPNRLTIERKNNNIGHTKTNCVLACFKCNNTRGCRYTFEEFIRLRLNM